MYLTAENYLSEYREEDVAASERVRAALTDITKTDFSVESVKVRLAYWRKANAIHRWFVDNVQAGRDECQKSLVTLDELRSLKSVIERVLADRDLASELLPTTSGFFFGSTDYGDYYFQDLEYTLERVNKILDLGEDFFNSWDVHYQSSW